ncbi:MAG: hypothetical protein ACKOAE_03560 [Acidimicrobiaceae bacterium]
MVLSLERYESEVKKYGFALKESFQIGSFVRLSARQLQEYGTRANVFEFSEYSILNQVGDQEFDLEMYGLRPFAQISNGDKQKLRVVHESNVYRFWDVFIGDNEVPAILVFESADAKTCKVRVSMRNAEYVGSAKAIVASLSISNNEGWSVSTSESSDGKCVLQSGSISELSLTYGFLDE